MEDWKIDFELSGDTSDGIDWCVGNNRPKNKQVMSLMVIYFEKYINASLKKDLMPFLA